MNAALDSIPQFALYQPALLVLALLCFIVLIQNLLTAPLAFVKEEQVPGMPLRGDHAMLSFRVLRTHANSAESLAPYGLAVLLAVLVGVSPSIVNWTAGIFLLARLAFWVIYYSGVGKVAGGPRTLSYVLGLGANAVLVMACIFKIL